MEKRKIIDIVFTHPYIDEKGWIFRQDIDWDKTEVNIDNDDDNFIEWIDGIWKYGHWYNGTWKGGIWEDGTWENGIWNGGLIFDGKKYVGSKVSPKEFFNDN